MSNQTKNEIEKRLLFEKRIIEQYKKDKNIVNNPEIKNKLNELINKHTKHYNDLLQQID